MDGFFRIGSNWPRDTRMPRAKSPPGLRLLHLQGQEPGLTQTAVDGSSQGWQRKDWDPFTLDSCIAHARKGLPGTVPVVCAFHFTFTVCSPRKKQTELADY
jgi:hypothetical protein